MCIQIHMWTVYMRAIHAAQDELWAQEDPKQQQPCALDPEAVFHFPTTALRP